MREERPIWVNHDPRYQPEYERRHRRVMRRVMSAWAIIVGLLFVLCFPETDYQGIPAFYWGLIFIALGVLGLLGLNVFRNGPYDERAG